MREKSEELIKELAKKAKKDIFRERFENE